MSNTCCFCTKVAVDGQKFQRCSGCKRVRYCSRKCQTDHWTIHRIVCSALLAKYKEEKAEKERLSHPDPVRAPPPTTKSTIITVDSTFELGLVEDFENGLVIKKTYSAPHKQEGMVEEFQNNKLLRYTYKEPHCQAGAVDEFDLNGVRRLVSFTAPNILNGMVCEFENGEPLRETYSAPHKHAGMVIEYDASTGRKARTIFNPPHPRAGQVIQMISKSSK